MLVAWNGGRTGSSGKVFKHSVGDSSTEKPTTSRDSEGDAAAALSPDMSPGDGEPLVSSPLIFAPVTNAFRDCVWVGFVNFLEMPTFCCGCGQTEKCLWQAINKLSSCGCLQNTWVIRRQKAH